MKTWSIRIAIERSERRPISYLEAAILSAVPELW
jgi:hypothetical protein